MLEVITQKDKEKGILSRDKVLKEKKIHACNTHSGLILLKRSKTLLGY